MVYVVCVLIYMGTKFRVKIFQQYHNLNYTCVQIYTYHNLKYMHVCKYIHIYIYIYRCFGNGFLKAQGGRLIYNNKLFNELTITVVEIVQGLLSFGFQSSIEKISDLVPLIMSLLDGRSDPEKSVMSKGFINYVDVIDLTDAKSIVCCSFFLFYTASFCF
jgi:hypothetical protein